MVFNSESILLLHRSHPKLRYWRNALECFSALHVRFAPPTKLISPTKKLQGWPQTSLRFEAELPRIRLKPLPKRSAYLSDYSTTTESLRCPNNNLPNEQLNSNFITHVLVFTSRVNIAITTISPKTASFTDFIQTGSPLFSLNSQWKGADLLDIYVNKFWDYFL